VEMDPAVLLVCGYLRVNGYFTLTEFEVVVRTRSGYRALTDLDVIAVRLPTSPDPPGRSGRRVAAGILTSIDPELAVAEDRIDVRFVEVKQGEARFNPGMRDREVLEAGLRRVGGDLGAPRGEIATRLARHGGFASERARVRLMAIGSRAGPHRGHVLTHGHVLRFVEGHVAANLDALNAMEVGDPVVAFLELVRKARGGLPA